MLRLSKSQADRLLGEKKSKPKYRNTRTKTEDGVFDSTREMNRWRELQLMERAGGITNLQRQVPFILIPAQRDQETGKLLEREVKYVADFVYSEEGQLVVEDAKGMRTREYIIKRKLMLERHGIRIREV